MILNGNIWQTDRGGKENVFVQVLIHTLGMRICVFIEKKNKKKGTDVGVIPSIIKKKHSVCVSVSVKQPATI